METMTHVESASYQNELFKSDPIKCNNHIEQLQRKTECVCSPLPTKTDDEQKNSTLTKISFKEPKNIEEIRERSLSHWPHSNPSRRMMADNGWFSCNVLDRVICIYCDTICQSWTKHDDPAEVHQRLAPNCPFVKNIFKIEQSCKVINGSIRDKFLPHHPAMAESSRRQTSFSKETWNNDGPSIDDLVRCGFFYSGVGNVVTCFYCNGSLHKWSSNDNPMIEHARWFPSCLYAKHLCGDELHEKIQISNKRLLTENKIESTQLPRMVSQRLDLPIVVQLRKQFSLSIIKRCIEDQLRLKNDDFTTDTDLTVACLILKKQINVIHGCPEKIIIPSQTSENKQEKTNSKRSLGDCNVCLTEDKQLACMPCGHFCACVPCGYALKNCPMCRTTISSFVRINI